MSGGGDDGREKDNNLVENGKSGGNELLQIIGVARRGRLVWRSRILCGRDGRHGKEKMRGAKN